jgi:hypothetical protein
MTDLETILRRLRLLVAAVAALALLAMPSAASAKRYDRTRDRNHDGIPDKWEKRFHLKGSGVATADPDKDGLGNRAEWKSGTNPRRADSNSNGVKDGNEDADHDKLNNAGEDQAGTDPVNPDTDGDGLKDGEEKAGEVVSFDGTTLTLRLFGGSTISGTVDDNTFIDCGNASPSGADDGSDSAMGSAKVRANRLAVPNGDGSSDPGAGDGSAGDGTDDPGVDDPPVDDGSGDSTDSSDGSGGCAPDVLKVGAVVTEASLSVTSDGSFFDAIQLEAPATP